MRRVHIHPHVWRIDGRPACNIASRDVVGRASEPAADTLELRLRTTIAPCDVAAGRARLRGVGRIDQQDRDAGQRRLVRHEGSQLVEAPPVEQPTLDLGSRVRSAFPLPDALPNAVQVFECDGAVSTGGGLHEPLRDDMIGVGLKAPLFPATVFQQPLGALRPLLLEPPSDAEVPAPRAVQPGTGEHCRIARGRDVDDAQIDAEHTLRLARFWRGYVPAS